jgi:UDP-glucose 4-epimerase
MRILITGSTGFLGGSLGRFAARAGHEVTGTGRSSESTSAWPGRYLRTGGGAAAICEIVNAYSPDVLFHASGTASVSASLTDPISDFQGSVVTCADMLDGVRRSHRRPLIFLPSSAAVYGNPDSLPIGEAAQSKPISPYGLHKSMCETLAAGWAETYGLRIFVCRLFSLFGVTQRRLLVWELFKQLDAAGDVAWLDGTGAESRDFLHIDDVAEAVLQLADGHVNNAPEGHFQIVNVASGEETIIADLARQIRNMIAPEKEIRCRGAARPGDPTNWRADISRLRALIPSWKPRPLLDALHDCLKSWQQESSVFQHGA